MKQRWLDWDESTTCPFKTEDLSSFSSEQKIDFIGQLLEEEPLSVGKLEKMQELYNLSAVNNSEIKFRWIRLGLRGKWKDAVPRAVEMVTEQGRMKFLRPLYRYENEIFDNIFFLIRHYIHAKKLLNYTISGICIIRMKPNKLRWTPSKRTSRLTWTWPSGDSKLI